MDVGGRFERYKSKLPVCDWTLLRRTRQQNMIMHFVLAEDLQRGYIFGHLGQLSTCTIAKHPHFRFDYDLVKRYTASTIQRYQHPTQLIVFFTSAALVQLTLEEDGVYLRSLANGKVIYQLSNTKEPDDTGMIMNSLDVLHSFSGMATVVNRAIMGIFLWEVIVLGYDAIEDQIHWSLIEWQNGIASRLLLPTGLGSMRQKEWWDMKPQRRLIILG